MPNPAATSDWKSSAITCHHRHPNRTGGRRGGTDRLNEPVEESRDDPVHHAPRLDRHRHGYSVDLHRDLPGQTCGTLPGAPRSPPRVRTSGGDRVRTAHQPASTGLDLVTNSRASAPVPYVCPLISLTEPDPSGSTGPTRFCRGCSHPHRRPPAQAAASFNPPLRPRSDEDLSPPFEQSAPRGAPPLFRQSPILEQPHPGVTSGFADGYNDPSGYRRTWW